MKSFFMTCALTIVSIANGVAQNSTVQLTSENMAFFTVSVDGIRLASEASVLQQITGLNEGGQYNLFIDYVSPDFSDVRTKLVLSANGGQGAGIYSYTIPSFFQNGLRLDAFIPTSDMSMMSGNVVIVNPDGMNLEHMSMNVQSGQASQASMNISMNTGQMSGAQQQQQQQQQQLPLPSQNESVQIVYVEGYSGSIGCETPVGPDRFERMMDRIYDASFSDEKVNIAKQILRANCIVIEQLVEILEEVAFDEGQLDLAKFAYEHVYDIENYFEVYGVFSFSSSSEELDTYLQSQY
tara:strand:+ start:1311 stop:2195 length:885 start_codon:yes stop_codon:yes gene_type:complete